MTTRSRRAISAATLAALAALSLAAFRSPAAAEEPLKIGFSMAETGPLAGTGKSALLAMNIWAEDVNAKGGLLGRQVKLVHYDDQSNPANVPALYAKLKLAGLNDAPIQLAVFCDEATEDGHGLGARTMPETRRYSAVCALHTFWLAARVRGLGVGWVSILDPGAIAEALDVPRAWTFIAYLCVGFPREEHLIPELERAGWQRREAHPVLRR